MSTQAKAARVVRWFFNPTTFEGTALRFNAKTGTVSRPMRAGQDVCAHAWCQGASVEKCREVWRREQAKLIAEGFVIRETEVRE